MKIVHLFDGITGEYKGDYPAQADPLTPNAFIAPVNSTDIAPPAITANQIAVFAAGGWSVKPDFRGQTIYDQTSGAAQQVNVIGAIPAGFAVTPPPPTLTQARNTALTAIDSQAGATRSKYITTVAGQPETYLSKATDAAAYKAAGYPFASIANYVWVQAEAIAIGGATPTATQVKAAADGILAAQAAWVSLGAAIEQARRAGGVAVTAATTVAAVQTAQAAAVAALAAM